MTEQNEMFERPKKLGVLQQMTVAEFASLCDCSEKAVHAWVAEEGLSAAVIVEGRKGAGNATVLDALVAMHWFIANKYQEISGRDELSTERARLAREQADKTAMENAQRRGELGVISEMADYYGKHIDRAQRRLQQIPQALGQYCDEGSSKSVIAACERLINEAVSELAIDTDMQSENRS